MKLVSIVLSITIALGITSCNSTKTNKDKPLNLLVFSKTKGWRHKSIPKGIETMKTLATNNSWKVTASEDASIFNSDYLKNIDVVLFLNTTGDIFNKNEEDAFEKYISQGGGFVGIHSATDTEHDWPYFDEMIGAHFKSHPPVQEARIVVNQKNPHTCTAHLGTEFRHKDEWYNFKKPVPDYVNVLLELDESSYTGQRMGAYHPIAWYHEFKGGKIFYSGMGHTKEAYDSPKFIQHVKEGILWAAGKTPKIGEKSNAVSLFDKDLSKWELWMGVPHTSVKGLDGVEKFEDVKKGTPLGLNNDPKKVFSINEKGELHITGEIYGGLTTKEEYGNYHLKVQFKWGTKKWAPRLNQKRDSGILYHAKGKHGTFWNVWKSSLEFQVQEGDCGDFIALNNIHGDVPSDRKSKGQFVFNPKGKLQPLMWGQYESGQASKFPLNENPNGEWNTLEIYAIGDKSIHIVNGTLVNAVVNARDGNKNSSTPVTKGQIQIQSEGAELFYRNMTIESVSTFPTEYKKVMKWK